MLGASHTGAGGNKRGYAGGTARIGWAVQLIRGNNVSVVGLQEYEKSQHAQFARITGGGWGIYPGLQVGNKGVRNSISWNNAVWELVEAHTIPIPYFHGNLVPMPYVLLKHKATGRLSWFINIHNPASTRGPAQHWRDVATAKEIALMNDLQAAPSTNQIGTPTFLMGDFNEKSEAFCRVVPGANAQAANGGAAPAPPVRPRHRLDLRLHAGRLLLQLRPHGRRARQPRLRPPDGLRRRHAHRRSTLRRVRHRGAGLLWERHRPRPLPTHPAGAAGRVHGRACLPPPGELRRHGVDGSGRMLVCRAGASSPGGPSPAVDDTRQAKHASTRSLRAERGVCVSRSRGRPRRWRTGRRRRSGA